MGIGTAASLINADVGTLLSFLNSDLRWFSFPSFPESVKLCTLSRVNGIQLFLGMCNFLFCNCGMGLNWDESEESKLHCVTFWESYFLPIIYLVKFGVSLSQLHSWAIYLAQEISQAIIFQWLMRKIWYMYWGLRGPSGRWTIMHVEPE